MSKHKENGKANDVAVLPSAEEVTENLPATSSSETENLPAESKTGSVGQSVAVSVPTVASGTGGASIPAHLMAFAKEHAGEGVSSAQEDNTVPIITILQALSPQVNKRQPSYVEGAETGDIFLKVLSPPVIPGEVGFVFQPCHFEKKWVEWVPRDSGGGFIAAHDKAKRPPFKVVPDEKDPTNENKNRYIMDNGHELIETRYHIGFGYFSDGRTVPLVIPFTSAGHSDSRNWMTNQNLLKLDNGETVPSFFTLYRMRTRERSNKVGQTWFAWDISWHGYVQNDNDSRNGHALAKAFATGEKKAEDLGDELQSGPVHAGSSDAM